MKFSYQWITEYASSIPKPKALADAINVHAFEVEHIEKKNGDTIFTIDLLPNRIPDASGHRGMAREAAAITGAKFTNTKPNLKEEKTKKTKDYISLSLKDSGCTSYYARILDDITVSDSPKWLKDRLRAVGLRPINNVVDAVNYVMLDLGQPLHAFDFDAIAGSDKKEIIVRNAKNNESFTSLDGNTYSLDRGMMVITDEKNVLALAGIKGGVDAEVTKKTTSILLESAHFDRGRIHHTSRMLGLVTDASRRFSAGLDPNMAKEAIDHLASLIQRVAGGNVYRGALHTGKTVPGTKIVSLTPEKVNRVLGVSITERDMRSILSALGFSVKKSGKAFRVTVPSRRVDIVREEDLIEEIGRLYGYDSIIAKMPAHKTAAQTHDDTYFLREKIRDRARAAGFYEARLYSFCGQKDIDILSARDRKNVIALENPIRPEFSYLRPFLFSSLIPGIAHSLKHTAKNALLFEIGNTYYMSKKKFSDTPDLETPHIAFVIGATMKKKDAREVFLELKGRVDSFLESLGLADIWYDDAPESVSEANTKEAAFLHPYRLAEIKRGNTVLGVIGDIHPEVKDTYGIKPNVSVSGCEIDMSVLLREIEEESEYRPVSQYPAVMRDIALLVPSNVRMADIYDVIENTAGDLLIDTDVFDIYEGAHIPNGKKNIAFHLIFQSRSKTLLDDEVDTIMQNIINALEQFPEWEVRT